MHVEEIEGVGAAHARSLESAGAPTIEELLTKGATPGGRAALVEATGISHDKILTWVNHADLMRIKGVGPEYSELLEAAGVDSPAELAHRNPANLEARFQEVVAERPTIVRRIPSVAEITDWIDQSKSLPKVVEHGAGQAPTEPAAKAAPAAAAAAPTPAPVASAAAPTPAPVAPAATPAQAPAASTGRQADPAAASGKGMWATIRGWFGR